MQVPDKYKNHLQLSNSRLKNFNECQRKFYWSYENNLTVHRGAPPLRYGKVWHKTLEAYYGSIKDNGWGEKNPLGLTAMESGFQAMDESWQVETGDLEFPEDHRTKEAMVESFIAYIETYQTEKNSLEILATEFKYTIEIVLSEEEMDLFPHLTYIEDITHFRKPKSILFTGIIDLIVKEYGHIWAWEHKTTAAWVQQIVQTFRRSAQTIGYLWSAKQEYEPKDILVEGIIINLHHLSAGKLKGGGYGKKKIEFIRDPQMYTGADFEQWRSSNLACLNDIQRAKENNFYPMNLENCYAYNKPCPFTPLCEQNQPRLEDTITDAFIVRERDV